MINSELTAQIQARLDAVDIDNWGTYQPRRKISGFYFEGADTSEPEPSPTRDLIVNAPSDLRHLLEEVRILRSLLNYGDEKVSWQVTYFPPDKPEVTRRGAEAHVRAIAEEQAEWNPIVEHKTTISGDWIIS